MREFHCKTCGHTELLTDESAIRTLRAAGRFRRVEKPRLDLVVEILESSIAEIPCARCSACELQLRERSDFDDAWPEVKLCEVCKAPIPLERLEIFPESTRCAKCQGVSKTEADYCPVCGAIMQVRQKGRTSTYQFVCTECRYVDT